MSLLVGWQPSKASYSPQGIIGQLTYFAEYTMKRIPLTQNKFALVDDEDYDFIMQWKWCFHCDYATRCQKAKEIPAGQKRKIVQMHRVINKTPDGCETDHVNGDRLDNRKSNLRSVTTSQNQRNQHKIIGSSRYKGVSWKEANNRYVARIKIDYKEIHLGSFKRDEEKMAAMAYNAAAIKYFGEHACLNKI